MARKTGCCSTSTEVEQEGVCIDKNSITPEQRYCMIADIAYFRAEKRGFVDGDPVQDWVEAEREIDCMLGEECAPG